MAVRPLTVSAGADPDRISSGDDLRLALESMRAADGRSYQDLAVAAGIGVATLHDMIMGRSLPRWGTLAALLSAWGVPASGLTAWRRAHARAAESRRVGQGEGPRGSVPVAKADPLLLGVHRTMELAGTGPSGLPGYFLREADTGTDGLRDAVRRAGESGGFVVVVGDSSVGKTRSLFEAVSAMLPQWWLL